MLISELPPEYRELAEKNRGSGITPDSFNEMNANSDDLFYAFKWSSTPEKNGFWRYCRRSKSLSDLPPLPASEEVASQEVKDEFENEKYETRITQITVIPTGKSICHYSAFSIEIRNESGEEFVEIISHLNAESIKVDSGEWPFLRAAIDQMISECRKDDIYE